jgi:hypothetical protein
VSRKTFHRLSHWVLSKAISLAVLLGVTPIPFKLKLSTEVSENCHDRSLAITDDVIKLQLRQIELKKWKLYSAFSFDEFICITITIWLLTKCTSINNFKRYGNFHIRLTDQSLQGSRNMRTFSWMISYYRFQALTNLNILRVGSNSFCILANPACVFRISK